MCVVIQCESSASMINIVDDRMRASIVWTGEERRSIRQKCRVDARSGTHMRKPSNNRKLSTTAPSC